MIHFYLNLVLNSINIGNWGVGLANRRIDLNKLPLGNDNDSWVLRSDACIYHNSVRIFRIEHNFEESDVLVSENLKESK